MSLVTAKSLLDEWVADLTSGKGPVLHSCGPALEGLKIGPGLVTLIGGAPGAGKTALTMQAVIDALRADSSLRVMVANVEMSPTVLMDRQLSRMSGIPLDDIRFRRLAGHTGRLEAGVNALCEIADRMAFHKGPFTLRAVADSMQEHQAGLIALDYVQRFKAGDDADREQRQEIDGMMGILRQWADGDFAVMAVSAVARQRGSGGSNYAGLGLASYRGSSELEYGADSAWVLSTADDSNGVTFECVKNRHGDTPKLTLNFDRARQRFDRACAQPMRQPAAYAYSPKEYDDDDRPF